MKAAMYETNRRRKIQNDYNVAHGIVPKTVVKSVRDILEISRSAAGETKGGKIKLSAQEKEAEIARLQKEMREASKLLEFEYAAVLRDRIIELQGEK